MKDGPDNSADVALAFGEVEVAIARGGDSLAFGGCVDTALLAFSLACIGIGVHRMTLPISPQNNY